MIVPELPADVLALKEAVGAFVETEVYPLETRIAERGSIDPAELEALRRKARAAGFAMLNMPPELGGRDLPMFGQVALEEESGKATNGLGFAVVDRGPRELHEIATPAQIERYVRPIAEGRYREAWALTEPGAGSDLTALAAKVDRDAREHEVPGVARVAERRVDPLVATLFEVGRVHGVVDVQVGVDVAPADLDALLMAHGAGS